MTVKRLKRPRDPLQLAKLVVDIATGQVEDRQDDGRSPAAVEMGAKGGKARARGMTPARRTEIAKKAAATRWRKKKG